MLFRSQGSYTVEMWTDEAPDPVAEVTRAKKMFDGLFDVVGIEQEPIAGIGEY